ncbi:MAG: hypothetical protein FWE48_05815, partial [Coriobacteriia bacterium]|nr:hypothetical protein [Coriobacteriia bacterium]
MKYSVAVKATTKATLVCTLCLIATLFFVTVLPFSAHAANYNWVGSSVPTVVDGDSVTIAPTSTGAGPSGTLSVPAGATVTINGTVTGTANGIGLNIAAGGKIEWNATLQGARPGSKVVTVTGSGELEVTSGIIVNVGSTSA